MKLINNYYLSEFSPYATKYMPVLGVVTTFKDVYDIVEASEEMILTRYVQANARYQKHIGDSYYRRQRDEAYKKALPVMQKYGIKY